MKCKTVHKKLIFYSNGELNSSETEEIRTHLLDCKKCYDLYTELETTLNLIEKKKILEPNPFLYTRIKQELDNIGSEKNRTAFIPVYKKVLQPVLLSLILAIGLFSGIKLGNTYELKQQEKLAVSQTTEFYFNDLQQEKLEVLLITE